MNIIYVDDEQIQRKNFRLTVKGMEGMESFSVNETGLLTVKAISRPRSGLRASALFHLNM